MATTDTATDYTINKTPLPLAATGHPMPTTLYMPAKGCPRCWVGGATIGWSVVDVEMQWGGMTEGGILGGI